MPQQEFTQVDQLLDSLTLKCDEAGRWQSALGVALAPVPPDTYDWARWIMGMCLEYSKDLHAGCDFICPVHNLHDATKCVWNLQKLVEGLHPEYRLSCVKLRFGPSDTEEAEQRVNSWDALRRVPLAYEAQLGPEVPLSRPEAISVRQLYRGALNRFWRCGDCKSWPDIMKEVAGGPVVDDKGSEYWRCTQRSGDADIVGGHWTSARRAEGVRRRYTGFVGHEWDEFEDKWVDILHTA